MGGVDGAKYREGWREAKIWRGSIEEPWTCKIGECMTTGVFGWGLKEFKKGKQGGSERKGLGVRKL